MRIVIPKIRGRAGRVISDISGKNIRRMKAGLAKQHARADAAIITGGSRATRDIARLTNMERGAKSGIRRARRNQALAGSTIVIGGGAGAEALRRKDRKKVAEAIIESLLE